MNNFDIEKNLKDAVSSLIPSDTFQKISMNITPAPEKVRTSMMKTNKTNNFKKYVSLAIAACLVIAIGLFGFSYYGNNIAVDSIVDIDVNPSIELSTNKKDVVIDVNALNEDAKKVVDGMELENTKLNIAVNAIIGSMLKNGYLDEDAEILVSVLNEDKTKADEIKKIVINDIDNSLKEHNAQNPVLNQTVTNKTDAEIFAENNGISVGKAAYILTLVQRDKTLKAEDLAKLSIHQISEIADERDIETEDVIEKNNKPENTSKKSEKPTSTTKTTQTKSTQTKLSNAITADKAKEIALNHAGVKASDVSYIRAVLDYDDGVKKYDVEFRVGNYEYDYEISAASGKVFDFDREYERNHKQTQKSTTTTTKKSPSAGTITADKAKEIAVKHAGVKAQDAKYIKAELDYDRGIEVYEVEFKSGRYEYDYEINAVNGNVIKSEKEFDE